MKFIFKKIHVEQNHLIASKHLFNTVNNVKLVTNAQNAKNLTI